MGFLHLLKSNCSLITRIIVSSNESLSGYLLRSLKVYTDEDLHYDWIGPTSSTISSEGGKVVCSRHFRFGGMLMESMDFMGFYWLYVETHFLIRDSLSLAREDLLFYEGYGSPLAGIACLLFDRSPLLIMDLLIDLTLGCVVPRWFRAYFRKPGI